MACCLRTGFQILTSTRRKKLCLPTLPPIPERWMMFPKFPPYERSFSKL
uniref:Uncharacterized protein n=1 Tax=Picea glauca TaxID=3330 RepID=A0A101LWX2_PICGL|nr:hypothetical protein ABT39_MTgene6287 [Picea glauca]